ncbi:PTS mannitol transporter subunit IICBA [Vagococcus jeotgali]|uniref:PTS mannitol transporter subunit IICBA n=1 Tax=Vagococcus jeotgali TaxID=3109030 RepID=UPI002DD9C252|nr:PTS mannitol transporter subunit IICBA [Vagococcus sp. B2T-5]
MNNEMGEKKNLKVKVQRFGSHLSGMVMPNIGAFIAWGVITALFIDTGWLPNEQLATLVSPMLTYLLPLLIGYTGGNMVHGQRGAVVGAIATMGVIVGSDVPMFIGAMIMGPLGGWCIKKFDESFQSKIKTGFEMLVNNFSSGLIGFALAIVGFFGIGPIVTGLTHMMAQGVETIISMHLLPLANILIEPAKILFLNNAINHGILTPLGAEQVASTGKSILFLLEANPGPGLGVLLAFTFFGKGSAKSSAPGAIIIQFLGGIHEIYFPYVMMKPALLLAVIAGGVSGTFTFQLLGAGLQAAASPGSIFAILAMTPKGTYLANILGIVVGAVVSFLIAAIILKADKSSDENTFSESQKAMKAEKAQSKGQIVTKTKGNISNIDDSITNIIFACDAGMGSSAMGASVLRNKVKKAGLSLPVTNSAINNLVDSHDTLVVTQEELYERARNKAPNATFITVSNFMDSPRYDEIVDTLLGKDNENDSKSNVILDNQQTKISSIGDEKSIVFAYEDNEGSANMGATMLKKLIKDEGLSCLVDVLPITVAVNKDEGLLIVNEDNKKLVETYKGNILLVDNFVTTEKYDYIIQELKK